MDTNYSFHPPTWPRLSGFHLVVPRYESLPGSFNYRAVPEDTRPIHFFIRGDKYKLFGLIPATIHLFGTGDENYPVYLLGTDQFGRDVLSRLLYGSQISLSIGIIGILLSFTFGMIIGGISGYFSGWTDTVIMRLCELIMSIPALYLIISLRATFPPSMSSAQVYAMIIIILSFIGWASMARVIRGMTLSLREQQFVLAARALGQSHLKVIVRHILPNTFSYVIVAATLSVPYYILGEVVLSFLGRGHPGAERQLGQHADRRPKHRVFAELSLAARAGRGHFCHRSRFQLPRRWFKRRGGHEVMTLLEIKNLKMDFGKGADALRAVDGVSLTIGAGETVCLVGESGCGKSVTALSIARLVPAPPANYVGGEILLNGRDVLKMSNGELRNIRGGVVSYVFQEPGASLNPVFRVGNQIKESLKLHQPGKATDDEVIRLLKLVGIPAPESRLRNYPFEMSGGMQQRVMIAMALASEPKLLVADEPTTALDVTIQAQILDLLRDLKQRLGMAILLITHNLGIVGDMADRVAVMYAGQIVELSPAGELLRRPLHPYTQALINSVPKLSGGADRLSAIPGNVPRIGNFPPGCRFAPRCPIAKPECSERIPDLVEVEPGRWVRCPFWK